MNKVTKVLFDTDWKRINAYESESIWVAEITYENGKGLRLEHEDREELIKMVNSKLA